MSGGRGGKGGPPDANRLIPGLPRKNNVAKTHQRTHDGSVARRAAVHALRGDARPLRLPIWPRRRTALRAQVFYWSFMPSGASGAPLMNVWSEGRWGLMGQGLDDRRGPHEFAGWTGGSTAPPAAAPVEEGVVEGRGDGLGLGGGFEGPRNLGGGTATGSKHGARPGTAHFPVDGCSGVRQGRWA